jgi:hypothetical protein
MKKIFFVLLAAICSTTVSSQLPAIIKKGNNDVLQKVIADLPYSFANIRGEQTSASAGTAEYKSAVSMPDAQECTITIYSSTNKFLGQSNCSWQAKMKSTESFAEAAKQYKKIFQQINNSHINYDGKRVTLKSKYETPDESVGFTSVSFEAGDTNLLKVDVQLTSVSMEWNVVVNVYTVAAPAE